jgi:hypothetical protein
MPLKFTNKTFSQEIITLLLKGGSSICFARIRNNSNGSGVRVTFSALIGTITYDKTELFET